MRKFISTVYLFTLTILISTTSVWAGDIALVIGNRTYQQAGWMYDAEKALNSASALRSSGYTVVSGRDLSAAQTRQALNGFLDRLDDAERAVVILNGHFVKSRSDTWFVPVDASRVSLASINYEGLSLSALLEIIGQKPGGAAVFLGTFPRQIELGVGLERGIGDLDIPQGVFVATGKPDEIDLTVRRDFLQGGAGFAEALAAAPPSVSGFGFISDMGQLAPGPSSGGGNAASLDEGYWRAVMDMGTNQALEAYLTAFPYGTHAAEAQSRLNTEAALTPQELAKRAEANLNLSRNARKRIQEHLSLLGYDTRGIDGIFGRGSRNAIARWQRDERVSATGYLENNQILRLGRQAEQKAAVLAEEARRKQREMEDSDRAYWQASGAVSGSEIGLRRYLFRYPDGLFADVARVRLDAIQEEKRRNLGINERNAWDQAETLATIDGYVAYLTQYPGGLFAGEATARLAELRDAAAKQAVIDAAKQEEADLRMNILARILVENQLVALGFDTGVPDGRFDENTRRAIRQFQRTRGFPVTGYLTRQSVVRLIAEAGN